MANVTSTAAPYETVERLQLGNRLLRRRDVELKTGKSRSAIYAGVSNGTFPAPLPIGDKSVAWLEEEVDSWIANRLAERNRTLAGRQIQHFGSHAQEARA
ncbi:helix-turn-helix transcriptional regulator [Salinicola acroporae]|uniref:AlpA family transcriptional regulator n=1 Tax=Salinicola acroporae TaxID=1541440 RepID=A0ABT6I4F2_9GAMM|nr:AlpA family transcriptional regulator [Salinicola acroporae]MDH4572516.1 AlpA family transcriptional regulator [Salinicola acroporae]